MRWVLAALAVLFLLLQYRLWVGEGSLAEVHSLHREIDGLRDEIETMRARNRALQAEVNDLNKGHQAIEERARSELGMIRENEVFYQIIEEPAPPK